MHLFDWLMLIVILANMWILCFSVPLKSLSLILRKVFDTSFDFVFKFLISSLRISYVLIIFVPFPSSIQPSLSTQICLHFFLTFQKVQFVWIIYSWICGHLSIFDWEEATLLILHLPVAQ